VDGVKVIHPSSAFGATTQSRSWTGLGWRVGTVEHPAVASLLTYAEERWVGIPRLRGPDRELPTDWFTVSRHSQALVVSRI